MQKKLNAEQCRNCLAAAVNLDKAFCYADSPEGYEHWENIYSRLRSMAKHGTTDGNPWVEPVRVPTDEDARNRPRVLVRDKDSNPWQEAVLVAVSNEQRGVVFFAIGSNEYVEPWRHCRFPTEQESALLKMGQHIADAVVVKIDRTFDKPEESPEDEPQPTEWTKLSDDVWGKGSIRVAVPTDEDARRRPGVMVRDGEDKGEWSRGKLLAVTDYLHPFVIWHIGGISLWKQCRFPIEGE